MRLEEPIDEVHAMSVQATLDIRRQVNDARRRLGIQPRCYEQRPHVHKEDS